MASDIAQLGKAVEQNDLQTATAEALKPWSYYKDEATGFNLILPAAWLGSFVKSDYSTAELLTVQRVVPHFGSTLEEASSLGEKRPLFIATGKVLSASSTFQLVELFIWRVDRASLSSLNTQDLEESYESNRHAFLIQYSDEITTNILETVSNKIYEFSFCLTMTNEDKSVCISEYHVLSHEVICQIYFLTPPGQGITAREDFQSIAEQVRCQ